MSLEAKIEALTAAVVELRSTLIAINGGVPTVDTTRLPASFSSRVEEMLEHPQPLWTTEKVTAEAARQMKEAESMASFKKAPNVESKSSTPKSGEPSQPTPESSKSTLDYAKDVKPITLKLSKEKGREITIAVLSRFGVKGAQDLDQAQWADYIAHCEKVLAGGEV